MTPIEFTLVTLVISVFAGLLGSLLGLGGGMIVVPALTLFLHIDIRYAIGASIVSVIATSSGAAAAYVREHMTNLRVAMFLETATTLGAITGATLAGVFSTRVLYLLFAAVMGYSSWSMFRHARRSSTAPVPPDRWADRLRLHSEFYDQAQQQTVRYRVTHTRLGWALMYMAGITSGLLGIGSGVLKVPTMDLAMRLPIKVSSATSNFMIGVTAAASAGVYFARGNIDPFITAPVALGVLLGATLGSLLLGRLPQGVIRAVFVVVLVWVTLEMTYKGVMG